MINRIFGIITTGTSKEVLKINHVPVIVAGKLIILKLKKRKLI